MDTNEPSARLRPVPPRWTTLPSRRGQPWLAWCKGAGFLIFHVDLFLVAIAALLLVNIMRSPDHLWVGGVFWRWGMLLVIHGMVTLLIWLIGLLLNEERPGTGTYEVEWSASPGDGMSPPPVVVEPVEPSPEPVRWTPASEPRNGAAPASDGWHPGDATPLPGEWYADFEPRTSWSETTASAWLARRWGERESGGMPAGDASAEPPAESS